MDIANSWVPWKQQVANVDQIKVPAWLLRNLSSLDKVELHGFGYVSERAYRGSHWERVSRQLKERLWKVLGKVFPNYIEMMLVMTNTEVIINSRPLTYIGDDIRGGRIVTAALSAIGRDLRSPPDGPPKKALSRSA